MDQYATNALCASAAALTVFFVYCAKPAVRFLLYGMALTRVVVYFVAVADACQQSVSCEHPDRERLQDFLLAQLFASGFAQDLSIWFMYVRKPTEDDDGAFQPYVFPYLLFAALATITYYALSAWERYHFGFLVGALVGTFLNMCFFYYFVYRAVRNAQGDPDIFWPSLIQSNTHKNRRRVVVVSVLVAITVSNTLANWIMYGLTWIHNGPALYAYPIATMVLVALGSIACLKWAYAARTDAERRELGESGSAWDSVRTQIQQHAQHVQLQKASVGFAVTFAYVFGVGVALSNSTTVVLSVTIASIPYFSFIVVPLSALVQEEAQTAAASPNDASNVQQHAELPPLRL